MATFVLVHGAYSGGHVFRRVRRLLRDAGHEVTTPTLTGIGERSHLVSPQVRLETHITDLVNHVEYEDLHAIVLLGYSLGGMVITGALERLGGRIAHLVYLDAFVPNDGESADSLNRNPPRPTGPGAEWLVTPVVVDEVDPIEGPFLAARRTPQPVATMADPVRVARPPEDYPFTRTYIKATGLPRPEPGRRGAGFWAVADRVRDDPRWRYVEIATNHLIPSNRPEEVAEVLLDLVR